MKTQSNVSTGIGAKKAALACRKVAQPVVVHTVAPSANPMQFRDQVQNGACSPIVDWYAFRCVVLSVDTGLPINCSELLRTAPKESVRRSFTQKNCYLLRISKNAVVHVYIGPGGIVHISGNPMSLYPEGNEFRFRDPAQDCSMYTRSVYVAISKLYAGRVRFFRHTLTRIDLTQMLNCESATIASATHRSMHAHLRARHGNGVCRKITSHENTIVLGANSKLSTIKLYRVSEKRNPRIAVHDDRWIRLEVSLRSPELLRLVEDSAWTPRNLNAVFQRYTRQLRVMLHQWRPDRAKHPPTKLPQDLRILWYPWVAGVDLRTIPQCTKNYGDIVRRFSEHGIDIRVAPTPRRIRNVCRQALTLESLLSPRRYDADGRSNQFGKEKRVVIPTSHGICQLPSENSTTQQNRGTHAIHNASTASKRQRPSADHSQESSSCADHKECRHH